MKNLIFLFLIHTASYGIAQQQFDSVAGIQVEANFFTTDKQSNVYVVKGNELFKYTKAGKLLYKYSNKRFGTITSVDVSNMLKPLLFYKEYLQVVYLDNTLSENGSPIALDEISFSQTQLVCASYNNNMWLYDQQNMELRQVNNNLETVQRTGNLNVLLGLNLQVTGLMEYNNRLYLNTQQNGILVFDVYGTYFKTVPLNTIKHFQPIGDWLYYLNQANKLEAYNIITSETKSFTIPVTDAIDFRIENDLLIIQTPKAIVIYN